MRSALRVLPVLVVAAFSLGLISPIAAQPAVVKDALKKAYNDVDARRRELNNGTAEAKKKTDEKVAEAVAEWHIYRAAIKSEKTDVAQLEFNRELNDVLDKKNAATKRAYINMLGPACVNAMKQMLGSTDIKLEPSMVIHAAQLLPIMARLKQDDVCNYLIELIEDAKTHDVVRLHALKAMREAMPIRIQQELLPLGAEDFKDKDQNAKRKHDAANVDALVKYIERSVQNMQPDDLPAFRFLRREAIISLAAAGAPAVTAQPKAPRKPLDGLVAPTLMKVLTKRGLTPSPNLHEKIEAAIGLCNMDYSWMPEYQSDVAVYLVGKTLVEFINEYNKDLGAFSVEGNNKQVPMFGFKAEGKRFEASLKKMEENAKADSKLAIPGNPLTLKYAAELRAKSKFLLEPMFLYKQAQPGRPEDFVRYVDQIRPKNGYPFKTLKTAEIPLD